MVFLAWLNIYILMNQVSHCSFDVESSLHFLFQYPIYINQGIHVSMEYFIFENIINNIDCFLLNDDSTAFFWMSPFDKAKYNYWLLFSNKNFCWRSFFLVSSVLDTFPLFVSERGTVFLKSQFLIKTMCCYSVFCESFSV